MNYYCKNCNKWWSHSVKKCIFCGDDLQEVIETKYKVIGSTQINVPSAGNEKVPYFNYLLEDNNENKIIIKSFESYEIGDIIDFSAENENKTIYTIGIVGTGQMGLGIAEYILQNGHNVIIKSRKNVKKPLALINSKLSKYYNEIQVQKFMEKIEVSTDFNSLSKCDIIIEAVSESFDIKKLVFEELSKICGSETIFATNTSSISIDKLSEITDRSDKFIGMHFFNPVSRMDLIEVVIGEKTSPETMEWTINFSKELEKIPIVVKNSPGFIVNRLLLPQINEAVHLLEKNIAKKEDIDKAMKLGLNHPMGPFQLADFIGIDICISILKTMQNELVDDKFKPANTLIELEKSGKLGFKTGEGFYKY